MGLRPPQTTASQPQKWYNIQTMSEIRVRFAPSPTGKVHIGNIRAAIYNWLFARHTGGKFLLRVEDTDLERSTPEAIAVLFDCMKWLGLDWDEEVFYQTKNVKRHLEVVDQLLASGHAYKVEKTSRDGKTGVVTMFRMPKEGVIECDDIVKGHMAKKAEDIQDLSTSASRISSAATTMSRTLSSTSASSARSARRFRSTVISR